MPITISKIQIKVLTTLMSMWSNRNFHLLLVALKNDADTLEDSLMVFLALNILLPYEPAIMLLGIYATELNTCPHKTLHMDIYCNFIPNYQNWESVQMVFMK